MNTTELVRNYAISVNDTDMYITILRNGKTYYTNYDEGFYELMKSGIFTSAGTNGDKKGDYLKFTCTHTDFAPYFHHIVFCYYYRGMNKNNYVEVLKKFSDELANGKYSIDHLQGEVYNNRKWNLSLMPQTENLQKSRFKRYFRDLFDIILAYDGEGYKVQLTYIANLRKREIKCVKYYCSTSQHLISLLRYLKANKWKIREHREGEVITDNTYYTTGNMFVFSNIFAKLRCAYDAYTMQKTLACTPKKEFTLYGG